MLHIYKSMPESMVELSLATLEKGSWIELVNPSMAELQKISEITQAPLDFLSAALDDEERSRIEIETDHILILIDIPILRSKNNYDTLPLGIIITTDYVITVCLEVNPILAEFYTGNSRLFCTFKKTRFLFQILYRSAVFFLKYIKNINRQTDEIERYLRKSMENRELFQLLELEKGLTYFSASLRSNYIVTEKLLRLRSNSQLQHLITMYEEDEDLLEDVLIEYKQAIDMVQMYSHILNGMMDVFASIISNNLNRVMKFLASMTIILAVPTMISSFWGMNVAVPFSHNPFGFVYVFIISVFITVASTLILWKRKMF